jgi:hypothetical protein
MAVADLTAEVLDSEVQDEDTDNALHLFTVRFAYALAQDTALGETVRRHWGEQGHTPALMGVLGASEKPVPPS